MAFDPVYRIYNVKHTENLRTNAGDIREAGLIPELGRFPGGGDSNPL